MSILVNENSKIIVQGITGREATTFARESVAYGAKVVGGVTPGKGGMEVYGIPVYNSVKEAVRDHQPDVSVISVPPSFARDAACEAVDNGIKLVVILTERIPRRDVVELLQRAHSTGATVVGPNSMGIICPGKTKIGMVGGPAADVKKAYVPGPVGIMSRSGGMTTELANLLTVNGIGQSTCVSIGGDPIVGSTFFTLLPLFEADPETKAVVIFSEPGGNAEETLARYVREKKPNLPIIGFIAGRFVDSMPGVRFGHAGTIVEAGMGSAAGKVQMLRESGVIMADRLADVPKLVAQNMRS